MAGQVEEVRHGLPQERLHQVVNGPILSSPAAITLASLDSM
jgi:hypothetical protein